MPVSRANLGRGPAIVTYGGATLFTRNDINLRHTPMLNAVETSMYGTIDKFKRNLSIRIPLTLWGSWENLSVLFPSSILNPTIGASLVGSSDTPLVVLGRNGDQLTYACATLVKLGNLYLGVDSELWAAEVEFLAIVKSNAYPEDAGAYFALATGQSYTDNTFAKTNFKKVRWTGAWGSKTGFGTIIPQKGFQVTWQLEYDEINVDGYGTVDVTLKNFLGGVKCIPIGPTLAQIEAQSNAQGSAHGTLLSNGTVAAADLTLTGGSSSVVLKSAGMTENGYMFGIEPLRQGEVAWETTRGFTAGAANAVATVG
ncbi:MAG: hypothetical protein C5B50_07790 [Verrucomicrobia bacterium]|nr:MAG: hypothetical protein C5B50_07790 [Verrucomicrobiota bacterium]